MSNIRLIAATRHDEVSFSRHCRLGLALKRLAFDQRVQGFIACANTEGLPVVYNRAIDQAPPADILLFTHDDVYIADFLVGTRLHHGLASFDVIGVAGNTQIDEKHVGWPFWREPFDTDHRWYPQQILSGYVGHVLPIAEIVS